MQKLIDYINTFSRLDSQAIEALQQLAKVEHFKKNEFILEQGQRCNKIWFLKSGMVRKFYIHDGKEITIWIHVENDIFTSLKSYSQQIPSEEYLQVCEHSEVIGISKQDSEKLIQFPQFVTFTNALMEQAFVNMDVFSKEFNAKDAKEKYVFLRRIAPKMVKRAKLGHIASIMGVTQETLSRVRRQA